VAAFGPDEALKQLLIVGYRTLSAQVQGDDHIRHRHRLRGGQAEDELLVVIGHRQPRRGIAHEVAAHASHCVFSGPAAPPHDYPGPGRQLLLIVRSDLIGTGAGRHVQPQPQHPRTHADQPRTLCEDHRERFVTGRRNRQDLARRPLHGLSEQRCPGGFRR
jgi:hypothetical protein